MSGFALAVSDLSKRYGAILAVDRVSFTVEPGRIVGLLGPNGAGKTTILGMLAGVVQPSGGLVRINGHPLAGDSDPTKRKIGLVPQELALYDELSAVANLRFFGGLYSMAGSALNAAIDRVLTLVRLTDRSTERVKGFSGGMKRRLNLAASLLHDPEILLLDEPTVGVDPQSRNGLFETLEHLRDQGKAIVYSTHYMEEAERLCDRVIILDHGQVVAADTVANLHKNVGGRPMLRVDFEAPLPEDALAGLRSKPGVVAASATSTGVTIELTGLAVSPGILEYLLSLDPAPSRFAIERPSLERLFLDLTGRVQRDS